MAKKSGFVVRDLGTARLALETCEPDRIRTVVQWGMETRLDLQDAFELASDLDSLEVEWKLTPRDVEVIQESSPRFNMPPGETVNASRVVLAYQQRFVRLASQRAQQGGSAFSVKATAPAEDGSKGGSVNIRGLRGLPIRFGLTIAPNALVDLLGDRERLAALAVWLSDNRGSLRWGAKSAIGADVPADEIARMLETWKGGGR